MKTVNSLSGGKTSSYLAVHYPADYELFSLVCIDDPKCAHPDKKIMQRANDKLHKYCPQFGEFIGTPEDPKILNVLFDLEQKLGREIIWLRGDSFDEVIRKRKAIPNMSKRFCTTEMKLKVIFWFCHLHIDDKVMMRVGYRYDEKERADKFSTTFKYAIRCEYQENSDRWIHRWEETEWRTGSFPLITDRIDHYKVHKYWDNQDIEFPEDSNCQMCFWKDPQQLRKNFDNNRPIMQWAKNQETLQGRTFKDTMSMEMIERIGLQQDFFFGTGSGCQAGFCTD